MYRSGAAVVQKVLQFAGFMVTVYVDTFRAVGRLPTDMIRLCGIRKNNVKKCLDCRPAIYTTGRSSSPEKLRQTAATYPQWNGCGDRAPGNLADGPA